MASTTNLAEPLRQNGLDEYSGSTIGRRISNSSRLVARGSIDATDASTIASGMELITYVFPDFKAVEYFQKEFVLSEEFHIAEESTSSGFEIYLIDQWIRSRKIGSFISVFTGNQESIVKVVKFTVVKKPAERYPPRFQEYLNELVINHATFKRMIPISDPADPSSNSATQTQLDEYLLVTNLTAFPHNLNLISVSNGDSRPAIATYMVNSNLRMFHCGGRSLSLLAEKVSDACESRFRQMYRVNNEAVPITFAILELVNLVQTCLFYYDLLDAKYADGLLCQKTEDAIQNWWNLVGLPIFNIKPETTSGVLSSKTVSAIISLTVSVKLRLQMFGGCDVPKDMFEFENFMLSIGQFQKQIGLEKKHKLDLMTLQRLFYYTNTSEQAKQMYSGFGNDAFIKDHLEQSPGGLGITQQSQTFSNLSLPSASVYRRNKIHYSKELKKLTNVVKNTVQDRIISKDDDDDTLASSLANNPSNKLRNKLASKLTEALTPADVETVDIDVFVKRSLIGKTLMRLWIGWPANAKSTTSGKDSEHSLLASARSRHNNTNTYNLKLLGHTKKSDFIFISFRDSVYKQALANDTSRKQGKRRFGFPNKSQVQQKYFKDESFDDGYISHEIGSRADTSIEVEEQPLNHKPSVIAESMRNLGSYSSEMNHDCFHVLNRRNSYPFISSGTELGLNSIDYVKGDDHAEALLKHRCASFSNLELKIMPANELYASERVRIDYVNQSLSMLEMECHIIEKVNTASLKLENQFEQTNHELLRLHNICYRMETRKRVIENDFFQMLEGKMNDLVDNIDRMSFRSRDLNKKINELEVNVKKFDHKVKTDVLERINDLTDRIANSPKFKKVFKDEEEMKQMYHLISGHEYSTVHASAHRDSWRLLVLFVYVYEFIVAVLHFLRFDRSRMNLDRIRETYHKIDPSRQFIDLVYKVVGTIPSRKRKNGKNNEEGSYSLLTEVLEESTMASTTQNDENLNTPDFKNIGDWVLQNHQNSFKHH